MKINRIIVLTVAVLTLLGSGPRLYAEPPSIMEAIREGAMKLEKMITQELKGSIGWIGWISNEMNDPEKFAQDVITTITPIFQGEGEITLKYGICGG